MLRKFAITLGLVAGLTLVIIVPPYIMYQFHVHSLLDRANSKSEVDDDPRWGELRKTVYMLKHKPDKRSRFLNFPKQKDDGSIRIGAFGDSFTWGDEVGSNQDFPYYLKKLFEKYGIEKVDVLNFGNSWTGFFQSYLTWEALAAAYEIDIAIFGPGTFFVERELMFNHTKDMIPSYLHSRFILRRGKVVRVDPPGNTARHRLDIYYRLIPAWTYLRFDYRAPTFLRPFWEIGETFKKNPFYYSSLSADREYDLIMSELIHRIREKQVHTIFASLDFIQFESRYPRSFKKSHHIVIPRSTGFPFSMEGHFSPIGYYEIAKIFFDALKGMPAFQTTTATFISTAANHFPSPPIPMPINKITILMDEEEVGRTFSLTGESHEAQFSNLNEGLIFINTSPARFYFMKPDDDSFLERTRCFKPLVTAGAISVYVSDCSLVRRFGADELLVGSYSKTSLNLSNYGSIYEIRASRPPNDLALFFAKNDHDLALRLYGVGGAAYDIDLGKLVLTRRKTSFPLEERTVLERQSSGQLTVKSKGL